MWTLYLENVLCSPKTSDYLLLQFCGCSDNLRIQRLQKWVSSSRGLLLWICFPFFTSLRAVHLRRWQLPGTWCTESEASRERVLQSGCSCCLSSFSLSMASIHTPWSGMSLLCDQIRNLSKIGHKREPIQTEFKTNVVFVWKKLILWWIIY